MRDNQLADPSTLHKLTVPRSRLHSTWRFPKMWALFGRPCNKDHSIWGYLGLPRPLLGSRQELPLKVTSAIGPLPRSKSTPKAPDSVGIAH